MYGTMCIFLYIQESENFCNHPNLVGGFNLFEKSSPSRGENKKYLKPPPIVIYVLEVF